MKLEIQGDVNLEPVFVVTLSRRNLKTLITKLDGHPPNSACAIANYNGHLIVRGEEDEAHYSQRPEPPGAMHPDTEREL